MTRRTACLFTAATLFLSAAIASASPYAISFASLDVNADGFVARNEVPADHELARDFADYDIDGDGRLDIAEFTAYTNAAHIDEEF